MLIPIPKLDRAPQPRDFLLYPTGAGPHGPTWWDPTRPMVYSTFWRWWDASCKRAGVRYRKPHTSRHTFATKLIRATGGDLAATQKALGHASIRTTIDVYTHLEVSDVARAVEAMEEAREKKSARNLVDASVQANEGDERIRTAVRGFAGLCLTTRPRRPGRRIVARSRRRIV